MSKERTSECSFGSQTGGGYWLESSRERPECVTCRKDAHNEMLRASNVICTCGSVRKTMPVNRRPSVCCSRRKNAAAAPRCANVQSRFLAAGGSVVSRDACKDHEMIQSLLVSSTSDVLGASRGALAVR